MKGVSFFLIRMPSIQVKDRCDHRTLRGCRAEDRKTAAAIGQLLAHVPLAISFLEEWLKADYPFKRCTYVFVEGLSQLFLPFGSLCLVKAELIARAADRCVELSPLCLIGILFKT